VRPPRRSPLESSRLEPGARPAPATFRPRESATRAPCLSAGPRIDPLLATRTSDPRLAQSSPPRGTATRAPDSGPDHGMDPSSPRPNLLREAASHISAIKSAERPRPTTAVPTISTRHPRLRANRVVRNETADRPLATKPLDTSSVHHSAQIPRPIVPRGTPAFTPHPGGIASPRPCEWAAHSRLPSEQSTRPTTLPCLPHRHLLESPSGEPHGRTHC